jgi:hypothetical protein
VLGKSHLLKMKGMITSVNSMRMMNSVVNRTCAVRCTYSFRSFAVKSFLSGWDVCCGLEGTTDAAVANELSGDLAGIGGVGNSCRLGWKFVSPSSGCASKWCTRPLFALRRESLYAVTSGDFNQYRITIPMLAGPHADRLLPAGPA